MIIDDRKLHCICAMLLWDWMWYEVQKLKKKKFGAKTTLTVKLVAPVQNERSEV